MNEDLRAARAAIIVDKDCVHKAQGSLPKEILCHHNMMLKLPYEQAKHVQGIHAGVKVMEAAADAGEAKI